MEDLVKAREQLEKAIDRLEAALAAREGKSGADLEAALAGAQAEALRLREAADNVGTRLDAAIGRLQSVLDGEAGQ